jgi:hypothetical protein
VADIVEKVSGIGSMSERTDLNVSKQPARYISGLPQGQGQATYDQQTAAPMAGTPEIFNSPITSLTAPTNRPNEPITAGADIGPGPGSDILNLPENTEPTILTTLGKIAQNDPTGDTELFLMMFQNRGIG